MQNPPTSTVTFLFTDIEGSTKRWEHHPQQMAFALQRHDAILRRAIAANGGVVFRTEGDAFRAAFDTALPALQAAVQAQQALEGEVWAEEIAPLRVRMALHTGAVEVRNGSYEGPALNRMARLLSTAYGGQTLLSMATEQLVRDNLPGGMTLRDLGEHRLKDLIRPERIFQLDMDGLPSEYPPLRTLENRPNNLPLQPTPLIGREKELAEVAALLRNPDVRLATLTGAGGTGKTRLALQAGADLLDDFEDGAWFVELAALTEPKLIIPTIAAALGVREAVGAPLIETLKEHLKDKKLLLVLDNFEQVIEAARDVSQLLSSGTGGVKALITSRIPLRLRGEREYAVPPMSLPDPKHLPTLAILAQYEAVRLFIERAVSVKADFEVTNDNAPAVAEICVRLDGLPLAIELAAARVRLFPPQALLTRLSQRLKVLTGGARDLSARQQTLRGAIDWSYDLLPPGEKQLFSRMGIFHGGRSFEALEAVCNYDGNLEIDILEGVESLVSKSLLGQREGLGGEPHFWMLETIHEYAREKLQESGEAPALEKEHALYFMRLAEEAALHLTGTRQQEWLNRLDDDYDNIRAALAWSGEQPYREEAAGEGEGEEAGGEVGLRIGGAIWRFWYVRGLYTEGRQYLNGVLARHSVSPVSPVSPGVYSAEDRGEGSEGGRQQQSLSRSRSTSRAKALAGAGVLAYGQADYTSARALHEESLTLCRELGDKGGIAGSLNNLGIVALDQGDYTSARALHEESLALRRELGDKRGIAGSLNNLGIVAMEQADYTSARALHEESLTLRRELMEKRGISSSLSGLGGVAIRVGQGQVEEVRVKDVVRGARLLGAVEGLLQSIGGVLASADRLPYERAVASARSLLGEQAFERARQEGRTMSMDEAIEYALQQHPEQ